MKTKKLFMLLLCAAFLTTNISIFSSRWPRRSPRLPAPPPVQRIRPPRPPEHRTGIVDKESLFKRINQNFDRILGFIDAKTFDVTITSMRYLIEGAGFVLNALAVKKKMGDMLSFIETYIGPTAVARAMGPHIAFEKEMDSITQTTNPAHLEATIKALKELRSFLGTIEGMLRNPTSVHPRLMRNLVSNIRGELQKGRAVDVETQRKLREVFSNMHSFVVALRGKIFK